MLLLVDIASPRAGSPAAWLEIIGEGRVKNQPEALVEAEPIPAAREYFGKMRFEFSSDRAARSSPTVRRRASPACGNCSIST
jgi:hypothetical protein